MKFYKDEYEIQKVKNEKKMENLMKNLEIQENKHIFADMAENDEESTRNRVDFIFTQLYSYKYHAFLHMMIDLLKISNHLNIFSQKENVCIIEFVKELKQS